MEKGIGVSTHTKTIRQNGVIYRYVYVLKKVVLSNEIDADELRSYDYVRNGSKGLYCFKFDHKTKHLDKKIYDLRNHKRGRPVGSKDSYQRSRRLKSEMAGA